VKEDDGKTYVRLIYADFLSGGRWGNRSIVEELEREMSKLYAEGYRLAGSPVYIEGGEVVWTLHRVAAGRP